MDVKRGVNRLLDADNADIIELLLKEGCVEPELIIECAKETYNTTDQLWRMNTINLLHENGMINEELSQIILELIMRSKLHIDTCLDTLKKMMDIGAIVPVKHLIKLPYEDFVEQMETRCVKIDVAFEIDAVLRCVSIDKLSWIREHSIEDDAVIPKILVKTRVYMGRNAKFYFDNAKHNSELADKVIMAILYINEFQYECDFGDHIIAEELSNFIVIFFKIHRVTDNEPIKKSLMRILHPNTDISLRADKSQKIANICSGTFEHFCKYATSYCVK